MSESTVHAIVLRRRDHGESDRRLALLTREEGRLDAVAKGARKGASRLSGSSEPLAVARLTLAHGRLQRFVTQAQPLRTFPGLRTDYGRLTMALALAELYAAITPFELPSPEPYDQLVFSLEQLDTHPKPVAALVWAELDLMGRQGFLPDFRTCVATGTRLAEAEPQVSAHAGGYICAERAAAYTDRFRTTPEVLIGLAKTAELEAPPPNLRFAGECLAVLLPFWREIAGQPLPANEACVQHVREHAP